MIASHVLTLTPDYVSTWSLWEAVRELLQNAIDQRTLNKSRIIFEYEDEKLTIGSTNAYLSPKTLLLGMTDKRNDATIGQFGEGYKLAMLVLTRMSYDVKLRNGSELWVPAFEYNEEYESHVLVINRYEAEDCGGVFFDITNVSEDGFGDIAEKYLPDVPLDVILDEDHLRKKVFLGGLFVCEIDDLEYGYNFAPRRLVLDRDRGMASSFDVSCATSAIWSRVDDDKRLYANLSAGGLDTSFVNVSRVSTNRYVVEQYLKETPNAIPVSSDDEAKRLIAAGNTVRRVPTALCNLLRRMHKFVFNRSGTPCERLERFQQQFGRFMNDEAKTEWKSIMEASKEWNG